MALIKCPECGKEFSNKAAACPNCGCPTKEIIDGKEEILEDAEPVVNEPLIEVVDNSEKTEEAIDVESFGEKYEHEEPPASKKKSGAYKAGAIIGGIIIVAAIAIFGIFSASSNEKEELSENLSGMWYAYEYASSASLEFETNQVNFEQDLYEWEDPTVIDSKSFGWEAISEDTIKIGGKEYKVTFDGENNDIMTLYPALTHDAEFENFVRQGFDSEIIYMVSDFTADNMQWDEKNQAWSIDTTITNNGKDSYKRVILVWNFENEDDDILDKKYVTATPKDGSLDPGEAEVLTTTVAKKEIKNIDDELDGITITPGGQEKVQ